VSLLDNNWRDQSDDTKPLRRAVDMLHAREQLAARAKLDLIRALEVLFREAITAAPQAQKLPLAELGCKVVRLAAGQ
jgi:hypothetical protein